MKVFIICSFIITILTQNNIEDENHKNNYCWNTESDTVICILPKHKTIDKQLFLYHINCNKDSLFLSKISDEFETEFNNLIDYKELLGLYFIFITKDGRKIEEGRCYGDTGFEGIYKYYYKNGKIKREGKRENGRKIGNWKFYNCNGKLKKIKSY
ncbi:MAG: hypothetical protein K9J13_09095 [Saprospiraceae bacterium]|nr:hypothetical protein [Saprospiraceae bacterium]